MSRIVSVHRVENFTVLMHRANGEYGIAVHQNQPAALLYWNRGLSCEQARADYQQLVSTDLANIRNPPVE